ncbi:hypothetical protein [Burkholderia multivorans]|uniref:hypothetical protein n=1 Tax=Burkholderia multivorans TaxID=87883 RepID=UPI0011B1F232|nr:hypothetical protein [Burkholderia multivorans]MDN7996576.1 hypothetical protein [Burkholderia multivorans]
MHVTTWAAQRAVCTPNGKKHADARKSRRARSGPTRRRTAYTALSDRQVLRFGSARCACADPDRRRAVRGRGAPLRDVDWPSHAAHIAVSPHRHATGTVRTTRTVMFRNSAHSTLFPNATDARRGRPCRALPAPPSNRTLTLAAQGRRRNGMRFA